MSTLQDHSIANGVVGVMVQSAMAELVTHVSTYLQTLTSEVVQQARASNFKTQICLQAQFLELQQLRLQLTDALAAVGALNSDKLFLQDVCSEKDMLISQLERSLLKHEDMLQKKSGEIAELKKAMVGLDEQITAVEKIPLVVLQAISTQVGTSTDTLPCQEDPPLENPRQVMTPQEIEFCDRELHEQRQDLEILEVQKMEFDETLEQWKEFLAAATDTTETEDPSETSQMCSMSTKVPSLEETDESSEVEDGVPDDVNSFVSKVACLSPRSRCQLLLYINEKEPGMLSQSQVEALKANSEAEGVT